MNTNLRDSVQGCLLGTAVGDAIGLPYEGLSAERGLRLLGQPDRHRFLFGRGMLSDDTEHTVAVIRSLIFAAETSVQTSRTAAAACEFARYDLDKFRTHLARSLRTWFLAVPAGVGMATARACMKLCLGWSADHSGVFSAGNGPAMRSAILGVVLSNRADRVAFARASCRLTHTDPKALYGAIAAAEAAALSAAGKLSAERLLEECQRSIGTEGHEFLNLMLGCTSSIARKESTREYVTSLGLEKGITGYVYHTVPSVLHACLSHPDNFAGAIQTLIRCGGDSDTTAAIAGGIMGAGVGLQGIPAEWIDGLRDWPLTTDRLRRLSDTLTEVHSPSFVDRSDGLNGGGKEQRGQRALGAWGGAFLRNLFFLAVVITHAVRRIFPPY